MTQPLTKRCRGFALGLMCAVTTALGAAQVLARPGWVGSGINSDAWWKYPVVYQVNPANFDPTGGSGLHGVMQHLDYIQSLGVDAILLTNIPLETANPPAIAPAYGSLDDFDDLIHEASRRNVRVLLDLTPNASVAEVSNQARFWLNRGVAGFHVIGTSQEAHEQAAELRKIASTYLGQRILIGDVDTAQSSSAQRTNKASDPQAPQLLLDSSLGSVTPLTPAPIRAAIESTENIHQAGHSIALLATDGPAYPRSLTRYGDGPHNLAIAKLLATILFTTKAQPLLYYGQELGVPESKPEQPDPAKPIIVWEAPPPPPKNRPAPPPPPYDPTASPNAAVEDTDPDSLLAWYRKLIELHHSNATINSGDYMTINRDAQNVLITIRKPKVVSPTNPVLVILCNLSGEPQHLSIKTDMMKLHLRGSFLRTVLRSDNGMGTMHLESMTIAPYTAYIGELRF